MAQTTSRWISGGITFPIGYKACGISSGIKKSKKKDLMLMVSDEPCVVAATFTTNKVKASCVNWNLKILKNHSAQAVIVNSGNANCLTGPRGRLHTKQMAEQVSRITGIEVQDVCVASTGVIGEMLPIKKIQLGIPKLIESLASTREASFDAAKAILTTDKVTKEIAAKIKIGGKIVRVGAIAKGSGMLHPSMSSDGKKHATMLCFISTDANITASALQSVLNSAVTKSFNSITVDADQSTNDMVLMFANGRAGNKALKPNTREMKLFASLVNKMCIKLAQDMVADAEGATKFVEISVKRAASPRDAHMVARSVASSVLVKTALYGCDPNWGRIAASIGYADAHVNPNRLTLKLGKFPVLVGDKAVRQSTSDLNKVFRKKNIKITIDLNVGIYGTTVWTSDLSSQYVKFNSAYTT